MSHNNLKSLYVDELRDIYNSEQQLIKALPKMAKAANSDELRKGFEEHLEQTRGHTTRLGRAGEGQEMQGHGRDRGGRRRNVVRRFRGRADGCGPDLRGATRGTLRNRSLRRGARLRRTYGRKRSRLVAAADARRREGNQSEAHRTLGRN